MIRLTIALLLIAVTAGLASAQPEILMASGSFEHGTTVLVSGSGFGENDFPAPILWDDLRSPAYELAADGEAIPTRSGDFGHPLDPAAPHASADGPGSEGSVVLDRQGRVPGRPVYALRNPSGWLGGFESSSTGSLYVDWWMKSGGSRDPQEQTSQGNRILRLQNGTVPSQDDVKIYENGATFQASEETGQVANRYFHPLVETEIWTHLAVWTDAAGGPTSANNGRGVLKIWRDNQLIHADEEVGGAGNGFSRIGALGLQALPGHEPETRYQFGDIFVNDSLARVMLADAPRWDEVRYYEMQIPQDWLISNISFEVNRGDFTDGDEIYLYVSDARGNINPMGFPVSDETLGPGQPGKPTIDR